MEIKNFWKFKVTWRKSSKKTKIKIKRKKHRNHSLIMTIFWESSMSNIKMKIHKWFTYLWRRLKTYHLKKFAILLKCSMSFNQVAPFKETLHSTTTSAYIDANMAGNSHPPIALIIARTFLEWTVLIKCFQVVFLGKVHSNYC